MVSWRYYHCSECKKSHIVKLQVVRFQIPKSTQSTTFYLYDTGKFEVGGYSRSLTSVSKEKITIVCFYEPLWYCVHKGTTFDCSTSGEKG